MIRGNISLNLMIIFFICFGEIKYGLFSRICLKF